MYRKVVVVARAQTRPTIIASTQKVNLFLWTERNFVCCAVQRVIDYDDCRERRVRGKANSLTFSLLPFIRRRILLSLFACFFFKSNRFDLLFSYFRNNFRGIIVDFVRFHNVRKWMPLNFEENTNANRWIIFRKLLISMKIHIFSSS